VGLRDLQQWVHDRTGVNKQRCTMMLLITAGGHKMQPFFIFKRKTLSKDKFPPETTVKVQESSWMTEELIC
jgi:hypothetical protein